MKRRRFMKIVAAGAAAALVQPGRALAAATKHATPAPETHPLSAATRKEIADEKKAVADALKTIRAYKLPPGSRLAFVFRAEKRSANRA
ncbi:MAG: hypothetical protein ACM3PF_12520 [Bacteroidota bacterium]